MKNRKSCHDDWDPCHPGLIHEAAQDLAVSRRRLFHILASGAVVGVVGGVVAASLVLPELPDRNQEKAPTMPAGIACITVVEHLSRFIAGQISEENLKKRIGSHLIKCAGCRRTYDSMRCSKNSGCGTRPDNVTLKPSSVNPPTP